MPARVRNKVDDDEDKHFVFSNISSAVDSVNHRMLSNQFQTYGLRPNAIGWILSFRSNSEHFKK